MLKWETVTNPTAEDPINIASDNEDGVIEISSDNEMALELEDAEF
jgi:hypothetical protein